MQVYNEGAHYKVPFIEREIIYNIRTRPYETQTSCKNCDFQSVDIGICVLTRPDANKLPTIYRTLGRNYETVLTSIVHEAVKSVIAQYNATQIMNERELVSGKICESVIKMAASYNIIVEDTSTTNISFGKEFTAAIEAKQLSQAEVERAQGEANCAELIGQANQFFLAIRQIEAEKETAKITSQTKIEADKEIARIMSQSITQVFNQIACSISRLPSINVDPNDGHLLRDIAIFVWGRLRSKQKAIN